MKTELDEILEFYQNEKLALDKLIKNLLVEREFKLAHIHQKASRRVKHSLFLLENLKNPNHAKIAQLQWELENLKKLQKDSPNPNDFIERLKQSIEQQIKILEGSVDLNQIDSQEFDDVIFDLVEGKINNFHFFINTKTKLYLDFKKSGQFIIINIPKYKKLKKNYILPKPSRNMLKNIGFKLTDDKKKLVFVYDISSFKDANPIKTIVSRVIYEGFGSHHIRNSSTILIID